MPAEPTGRIAVAAAPETTSPAPRRRRRWTADRISFMAVFLGLPMLIYVFLVVSPFIQGIVYSFTNWNGFNNDQQMVGLANYQRLLQDDTFLKALTNNAILAVVLPLSVIILAFALATMLTVGGTTRGQTRGLPGSGFYRVVSFFPYAIPAIVVGLMWGQVFDPSTGIVNGVLTKLGLSRFQSYAWLGDESTAMPIMIFVMLWGFVGFYMILFIAAIKGIPAEIYEAARIDGAGRFRTAVSITMPLIRDNVQTAYIYLGIIAIDAYVYAQALNPGGGPNNSTLTLSQYLMRTAFDRGQFGVACAMGVAMGLFTALFAAAVFFVNRITGGKDSVTMA